MLNLIVIRSLDIEKSRTFYEQIGLNFQPEQHGKGPVHYASVLKNDIVFEIYPSQKDVLEDESRLGFKVDNLDQLIEALEVQNIEVLQKAKKTAWGYRAVVKDPDGRKVELVEK